MAARKSNALPVQAIAQVAFSDSNPVTTALPKNPVHSFQRRATESLANQGTAQVAVALVREVKATPLAKVIVPKTKKAAKAAKAANAAHAEKVSKSTKKAIVKAIKTKVDTKNPIVFPTKASVAQVVSTKAKALARLTKPGVIVIGAGCGLIRVKAYADGVVTGIDTQHTTVQLPDTEVVPATKTQVEAYRDEFKRQGKILDKSERDAKRAAKAQAKVDATVIKVDQPVSLKSKPKTLLGYVGTVATLIGADNQFDKLGVMLVDGSDEVETYARHQLVQYQGKGPRFEDIPLFGAFIVKDHTHVKVSKSNAIRCVVGGSTGEPFAMLATATAKLGAAAARRFKKDDRVEVYLTGRPVAHDSK